MSRVSFEVLRANFEPLNWEFTKPVNRIVYATHPKGQTVTVWLDSVGNVVLTLPGRHTDPDAPAIFPMI